MTMGFSSYERRSIYQQPFYRDVMRIALPLPDNLTEQTSVSYDKSTELGSVAGSVVEGLSQGVPANLQEGLRSAETVATGIAASAIRRLANALSPNIGNAASALTGITANPFQVVLFKSPEFRAHTFSWQFAPKNRNETDTVNNIIKAFRYHALPGVLGAGGVIFSYPEILTINFRPQETANYMYEFKPCVVESVAVNYTPNGPSFFNRTGAPTAVQFTIRVQEIEIWTKADFLRNPQGIFNNATIAGNFFEP
jgi:hypothetical protein